jgi:signal transduction histidine kinase/DNA-binding response OmpR family regulator
MNSIPPMHEELHAPRILIVDDERANIDLLESFLEDEAYVLSSTQDPREVEQLFTSCDPDLLLLDLHMPYLDGFAVLEQVLRHVPRDAYFPVLVLTADVSPAVRERALAAGAKDFLTKPLDDVEVQLRIRNLLETRFLHLRQRQARLAAEAAERRSRILAEASHLLAGSLDTSTTLSTLARYLVSEIADSCVVSVRLPSGEVEAIGIADRDPVREEHLRDRVRREPDGTGLPAALLVPHEPAVLTEPSDAGEQVAAAADVATAAALRSIGAGSAITVPLRAAGEIEGGMLLARTGEGPAFVAADLELVEELALRAALAMENARLFHTAQQAVAAREQVLAVVAHDLRNPLSTVTMGTHILMDALEGPDHAGERRYISAIQRSAERMDTLIQDLLDITRWESGQLSIAPTVQPVAPVLTEVVEMHRLSAGAERIDLKLELANDLPEVRIDVKRIQQVLSNLLGNALKFTPDGGEIRVRGAVSPEGGVLVSVIDSGPGLAAEQLPHIFSRFWQGERTDRRGIGLGLAIAKGLVEAHEGEIWVESEPGSGCRFHFTLPPAATPVPVAAGGEPTIPVATSVRPPDV